MTRVEPQQQQPPQVVRPPAHVPSLDGLRTLAVFGVMAVHAGTPGANLGWLGVDLFFVLSGFLITTLLVREFDKTGTIHLGKFWCRRALRLMPAYWLYVGVMSALILGGFGRTATHGGWSPRGYVASLWGYFVNFAPMGGIWQHQMLTIALWSLAVEEQFYLLWPGLCWGLLKVRGAFTPSPGTPEEGRGGGFQPAHVAWAMAVGIFVYRLRLPTGDFRLQNLLWTRGIGIVIGCAIALTFAGSAAARAWRVIHTKAGRRAILLAIVLAVAVLTAGVIKGRLTEWQVHFYAVPPLDVLFGLVIVMLWYGRSRDGGDAFARAMAWRPVAYLGQISYGLYLYHMAAHELVWNVLLRNIEHWSRWPKFGLRVTVFFSLTIAIASLSYWLLERPFLKLKDRLR